MTWQVQAVAVGGGTGMVVVMTQTLGQQPVNISTSSPLL
jgi:hypothetical protein